MAKQKKGRPVNGVVLVNKPSGVSSNSVLQRVKRLYNARKAGHTGALDPLATGLLPVCLGEATKFSQILLDSDKAYEAGACLGKRTDTCDSDGTITDVRPVPDNLDAEQIQQQIDQHLSGHIIQVAPLYSALKVNGRPMYELARAGIPVEAKHREVRVDEFRLLDFDGSDQLRVSVACSKGTYIRSLIDELGELLGCGAHVNALHRTAHGGFTVSAAYSPEQLEAMGEPARDQLLLPVDCMIQSWPRADLTDAEAGRFRQGNPVATEVTAVAAEQLFRVYHGGEGRMLGIAAVRDGQLRPKRLINWDS